MKELWKVPKEIYGELYAEHLLEQYKLYVELMDRVSQRRAMTNTLFVSVNILVITILKLNIEKYGLAISILGLISTYIWYYLLHSYRLLNSGKFKVIHELEKKLPVALFDYEWQVLEYGKNRSKYWPNSHIEKIVPVTFGIAYVLLAIDTGLLN